MYYVTGLRSLPRPCSDLEDHALRISWLLVRQRKHTYTRVVECTSVDACLQMPGHMIGAAFAASAPVVPAWQAGLGADFGNVGGLVGAVLFEAGGWGKFLAVVCALTIPSAVAPTMCRSLM